MLNKKKAFSIRFYTVLLLLPFLIAICILLAFLHAHFDSIEQKSNYITDKMVPDFISTQNLQHKLQDLQHSLELIRFSNDFRLVDEAHSASQMLSTIGYGNYKDQLDIFKKEIAAFYDMRMSFYAKRKDLFTKVQDVNEISRNLDFYQKLMLGPIALIDRGNDKVFLKKFRLNYERVTDYCANNSSVDSVMSSCSVLIPTYEELKTELDVIYIKMRRLDDTYFKLSQEIKDFSEVLSSKHNYSLIKDIFEIEDTVDTVRHMVQAAVVIAIFMVIAEIFLIHISIINPIYKIAKDIRYFRQTKKPPKKLQTGHIEEIREIYSLLNPLFKDVSAVYSESFELQKENKDLKNLALIDDLTQLLNRRALNLLIREKPFAKKGMAVCMLDIDYFKCLNDSMGHMEGDKVLHKIACVLKEKVANTDLIYRYGGEEFCIILFDVKQEDVIKIACRLCKEIENLNLLNKGRSYKPVTISAGTSLIAKDDKSETLIDLIHQADEALYRAKNCGRNCAVSYEEVLKL